MTSIGLLLVVVIAVVVLSKAILLVPEGSVVMVFALGKFERAYGPGLHFGWFERGVRQKTPLKLGSIGIASSEMTIEISSQQIPVMFLEKALVGQPARIQRFDGVTPVVTHSGVPNVRSVTCEKCGHLMEVRL